MADAWPTIQPFWTTSPITTDFRRRWINQFGDKRQAVRGPNGQIFYPGAAGGARMLRTIPGSDPYHRATVAQGQLGAPTEREIPYAAQLREADNTPNDPLRQYRDNPNWSQPGVEASLARAAAIDAFKNSHDNPENQAHFQGLRTASEIMSDMRTHLANISNDDLSKLKQAGIDFRNFFGLNLDQPLPNLDFAHLENWPGAYGAVGKALQGTNPNVIAFLNDVARARHANLLAPPTGTAEGAGASPMELIPSGGFTTLLGLEAAKKGGEALWDYLGKKENLTNLRNTLPQDLNKTNQNLYDLVAHDPQGRWKQDQYDYVNRIAANPEFQYGGNAYGVNPIAAPDKSTPNLVNTPVLPLPSQTQAPAQQGQPQQPAQPGAQPAQAGQPVQPQQPGAAVMPAPVRPAGAAQPVQPAVNPNTPLGQRILQTIGHFFAGTLGQHGQPQTAPVAYYQQTQPTTAPSPAPVQVRRTQPAQTAQPTGQRTAPRAAPVQSSAGQIPERWGTPFVQGTLNRSQATAPVFSRQPLPPGFNSMTQPGYEPVMPTAKQNILPPAPVLSPNADILSGGTTSATPATRQPVVALHQGHVDQLDPGTAFTWAPDGNDYVKT